MADVLVVTLPPFEGGVPAKARILCEHLRERGHRVNVAWYATFRHHPELNVPSWRLATGARPGIAAETCFDTFPGTAIGCRLPELEAPYYQPSSRWRALIAAHDRHIAVGGPPMVGHLLAAAGVPHLLWCASDVLADRRDRQRCMPLARRVIDRLVTRPWLLAQQRRLLAACPRALGVSAYTLRQLIANGADPKRVALMPIPVDTARFTPPSRPAELVLGFAARFEDPRKNLGLLLDALAMLRRGGVPASLRLAGAAPSSATIDRVAGLGLAEAVEFVGELPKAALPEFYRGLDVFVLPSHQEGLCIAGIEAMAAGVPVVSTRCGGPEDYVRDGETGLLCGWQADEMAAVLVRLLTDRALRTRLGATARLVAEAEYSPGAFAAGLAEAWRAVWGDVP